jgi:hypothetical protein
MSLLTATSAVILSVAKDPSGLAEILRFAQDDKAGIHNG